MKLRGLIVVGVVLLSGCSKSPESTIESFYRALSKGEITEAKGYLSAKLVNQLGDNKLTSVLTREANKISQCGGIKSVDVKLKGEGEIRSGTTVITFGDEAACKQEAGKASLVKEDGNWKISPSK